MVSNSVDKASRLFAYLSELEKRNEKVVHATSHYEDTGGAVLQLEELIELSRESGNISFGDQIAHEIFEPEELESGRLGSKETLVVFHKPKYFELPVLSDEASAWLSGALDEPTARPEIKSEIRVNGGLTRFEEAPAALRASIEEWLVSWDLWSKLSRQSAVYQRAFEIQTSANQQADEFELVLGLGTLAWTDGAKSINRQLFTVPLNIDLNKDSGDISVRIGDGPIRSELDVVPAEKLTDSTFLRDVEEALEDIDGSVLSEESFAFLGQVTANGLGTDAHYDSSWLKPSSRRSAVIAWNPTIIMRRRQRLGLSAAFKKIAELIDSSGKVPAGLIPLVDPNSIGAGTVNPSPGAVFEANGELFTPLPLNSRQKEVLNRVDNHAQTIVQGPPGTGKTHMAAALLSHLLAQGLRVLVTAQADRALYELRGKLPEEIRELAVSVISSNQSDMADLKVAIDTINRKSSEFNENYSKSEQIKIEKELHRLQTERTRILKEWADVMEEEGTPLTVPGYEMSMSRAVEKWLAETEKFSWIDALHVPNMAEPFPLNAQEIDQWLALIDNDELNSVEVSGNLGQLKLAKLPSAEKLEAELEELNALEKEVADKQQSIDGAFHAQWDALDEKGKSEVNQIAQDLVEAVQAGERNQHEWTQSIKDDASQNQLEPWYRLVEILEQHLAEVEKAELLTRGIRRIQIDGETDAYVPMAKAVNAYLSSGGELKTTADGMPKISFFTKSVIKESQPFFQNVRVNGLPPTTADAVGLYLNYVQLDWALDKLRAIWKYPAPSQALSPAEQVAIWTNGVSKLKNSVLHYSRIGELLEKIRHAGLRIDWNEIQTLNALIEQSKKYSSLSTDLLGYTNTIAKYREIVDEMLESSGPLPWLSEMRAALSTRNIDSYKNSLRRGNQASSLSGLINDRQKLSDRVSRWSAVFAAELEKSKIGDVWRERILDVDAARHWSLIGQKISSRVKVDVSKLSQAVDAVDKQILSAISELAAKRAWAHAAGSSRIDQATRSNLVAYQQAVNRLGKGTGKYAEQKRRSVRKHLENCRSAVPVWIMPIYKVVEQFDLEENMFDVVIVDEASQAGIDAVFLQYLAPRIVVIGDDKQVSPSAVGKDREEIYRLAKQYLSDFNHFDSWTDPELSLFDSANQRYGGRIVLDEHRRCVPEIIEFSNKFIYEPENMPLRAVREVLPGRLAPFKITYSPDAYYAATQKNKVNTVEADMLVGRLLQVLDEPAYAGKSIGVISLLSSSGQAKYLQARLLEVLPPEIWDERDLKVGKPEDFQGAERDVIFLSMVQPSVSNGRVAALTTKTHLQRYNVAVSRAKDQVWLFHSISADELNQDDIRAHLLKYAYSVAESQPEIHGCEPVPDDEPTEPFDSLFEQRVYNEIVRRGYRVVPQYNAHGYKIDLVVEGAEGRLAVECDGDHWHGDDYAVHDRNRQRELERLGWSFVRIFESDFYLDRPGQLEKIWIALKRKGISPHEALVDAPKESLNVEVVEGATWAAPESSEAEVNATGGERSDEFSAYSGDDLYSEAPYSFMPEDRSQFELDILEEEFSGNPAMDPGFPPEDTSDSIEGSQPSKIETVAEAGVDFPGTVSEPATKTGSGKVAEYGGELQEYRYFEGQLESLKTADIDVIKWGILRLLDVEGPITGKTLGRRMATLGGDAKCGNQMRKRVNKALLQLHNSREIVIANPLGASGYAKSEIYLPLRSAVIVRELGPRTIDEVPFNELKAHMTAVMRVLGSDESEAVIRGVAGAYGFTRLGEATRSILSEVYEALASEDSDSSV